MGQLRLNLLLIVLVGLLPVLSFGVAEEIPQPSEGICYKVFYEANFKVLIKLRPLDYTRKISSCIASTGISSKKQDILKLIGTTDATNGKFAWVEINGEDYGWTREGRNVGKYRIVMVEKGKVKLELFGRVVELKLLPEDAQWAN